MGINRITPSITVTAPGGSLSSGVLQFSNSNGVSFGINNGTLTGSVAAAAGNTGSISAGTTRASLGEVVFSNSNGLSFGVNGQTVTASHNGLTSQSNQAFSADASSTFQTLSFQNSNGVSFSNNAGALRVTHDLQFTSNTSAITSNALNTSASRVFNVLAATNNTGGGTASLSSNVSLSNANGATFYTSAGNAIALSYTVPTVPAQFTGGFSTGGNTQGDTGLVTGRLVLAGGPNITLSGSTNGGSMTISVSGGAGAAGNTGYLSAGTTNASLGTVSFSNSNGISFGIDGQTITASHNGLTSQSNQAFSAAGGSSTFQTLSFSDANGISFANIGGQIQAAHNGLTSQSNQAVSGSNGSFTFQTLVFGNSNSISIGTTNTGADAVVSFVTFSFAQSNQNVTAANGGFAFQTLSFSNANGVSFGTSAGSAITASVAAQTAQTAGIYAVGNTTGQSSSSTYDARTLSVDGAGIVSAGWSNGSLRISATQSNQAFSAGGGASTFQTLSFSNANGATWTNTNGQVGLSYSVPVVSNAIQAVGSATGSGTNTSRFAADDHVHEGVFSVGVSTGGNTAGDTRVGPGRFVLVGGNNITLSQATAAGALNTISIVGAAGGAGLSAGMSTNGNTSGDTGLVTGRLVMIGGNNITLSGSTNGGSMSLTISAPNLGAGAMSAGVSTGGNTAGATGITGTQLVLVGSGVLSLSQTTGANGGTVSFLAPATSSLSAVGPVTITPNGSTLSFAVPGTSSLSATGWASISTNGSTISIGASTTMNVYAVGNTTGTSSGTVDIRTLSIQGAGGVYVGASNSGLVVSRPLDYDYEPIPVGVGGANTGVTNALGLGSLTSGPMYLWPVDVADYVAAGYLNLVVSHSFSTLGNSSGRQTAGMHYGIYTRGSGASTSQLSLLTSHSLGWSVTGNNSSYTMSYGTSTNTAGFTYSTTASAGSNVTSQFTGAKLLVLPIGTTLTPGMYWLGIIQTVSTSSIIVGISQSVFGWNLGTTLQNLAPFGSLTSAYTGTNADLGFGGPWRYGQGSWTTANNSTLPGSIGINSITKGGVSNMPFMKFWSNLP